jgi:glycine betaine/proline transport system substrate-binding protein
MMIARKTTEGGEMRDSQRISRQDFLKLSGAGLAGTALLGVAGCAGSPGSKELNLAFASGWLESVAVAALTKVLLERDLGYEAVTMESLELGLLFQSVADGELDAFQDLWMPTTHKSYWEKVKNDVVRLDPWYKGEVNLGLAVPNYAEAQSIPDLKRYRSEFGGRIVGIEPGAGEMSLVENEVIPGYNLNYDLVPSSTPAMLAELQGAINNKESIVVTAWKPHPMFIDYPIRYLEDPKGLMGGEETISTITREGLEEDLPDAFALLDAVTLNEEQLLTLEVAIREGGEDTPEKGVKAWLKNNRSLVQPWIDAAKEAQ